MEALRSSTSAQDPELLSNLRHQDTRSVLIAIENSLMGGDLEKTKKLADQLYERAVQGRQSAIRSGTYDHPLPTAERLIALLASPDLQSHPELQYKVGRSARCFVDLTFLRFRDEKIIIDVEVKDRLLEQLRRVRRAQPETCVGMRHEMKCAKASMKLLGSKKSILQDYCVSLSKLVLDRDFGAACDQIQRLSKEINRDISWIGDVHYIYLVGSVWDSSTTMLDQLTQFIRPRVQEPHVALSAVNVFAELIWRGSREIQEKVLSSEPSILTLVEGTSRWLKGSLWSVRYQAVIQLTALKRHQNNKVRKAVEETLLRRCVKEKDPRVRALLQKLEQDSGFTQKLQKYYAANKEQIEHEFDQEKASLQAEGERLTQENERLRGELENVEAAQAALDQRRQSLEGRVAALTSEVAAQQQVQEQRDALARDLAAHEVREAALIQGRQDLIRELGNYRALQQEYANVQEDLKRLEVHVDMVTGMDRLLTHPAVSGIGPLAIFGAGAINVIASHVRAIQAQWKK